MSAFIFDQLTGPLADVTTMSPIFSKFNKYGIMADVEFDVTTSFKANYKRRNGLFTNVVTPFGKLNIRAIRDVANYDGFNAKVINQYGNVDEELLNEALKASMRFRPGITLGMSSEMAGNSLENHVGVIFNLMRMKIYAETDKVGLKFNQEDIFYDDGHVAQSFKQFLGESFTDNTDMVFNDNFSVMMYNEGTTLGTDDYCPNLSGFNQRDVNILAMSLGGWKYDHPIRVFSTTPQIANRLIIPSYVKDLTDISIMPFTAREVDVVLKKLIMANRLGAQFDLAYMLLVSIMFTPVPRAIEANAWVSPTHKFDIPRAGSIRGLIPEFVTGMPYYPRPSCMSTWENYKANPMRMYLHGISVTEALYTGLFEVLTNSSDNVETGWANVGVYGAGNMTPIRVLLECCSLRFGKQFEIKWETMAGADLITESLTSETVTQLPVEVTRLDDSMGYEMYQRVTSDGIKTRIRSRYMRPVMFPVLSYGINDDRYYINSLKYSAEMGFDNIQGCYKTTDYKQANKMLTALRMGGYDATMHDAMTGNAYRNWSANSNGQVMPDIRPSGEINLFAMMKETMRKRTKSWLDIVADSDKLKIEVEIKIKTYALFQNGKLSFNHVKKYNPAPELPRAQLDKPVITAVIKTAGKLTDYRYQDFLLQEVDSTEQPTSRSAPLGIQASLLTDIVIAEDGVEEQLVAEEV